MRVLIALRGSGELQTASMATQLDSSTAMRAGLVIPELIVDPNYPPTQVPAVVVRGRETTVQMAPEVSTYLIRGTITDGDNQPAVVASLFSHPNVVGVFSDPTIESCTICPGDPPRGSDADVARLAGAGVLSSRGMDGKGVLIAIVDTGVNVAYLKAKGRSPLLDSDNSWTPSGVATSPGAHPANHGTMCAYDVGILAPAANLLDCAVLLSTTPGSTVMAGLLSDAVLAYSHLMKVLDALPARSKALVVSNSWGMFSPRWDFPVGHPGNYSDNLAHPFNVIVGALEAMGADVLFAAGNCGRDCPDSRCAFGRSLPICGANSHPSAICVAGIDTDQNRVGYSSQGPGRLARAKPDIAMFTHFRGSGVYPDDGGTSASCPVAAGLVAAVRTRYPATEVPPEVLRSLIFKTARPICGAGFNYDCGWGTIDSDALLGTLP